LSDFRRQQIDGRFRTEAMNSCLPSRRTRYIIGAFVARARPVSMAVNAPVERVFLQSFMATVKVGHELDALGRDIVVKHCGCRLITL